MHIYRDQDDLDAYRRIRPVVPPYESEPWVTPSRRPPFTPLVPFKDVDEDDYPVQKGTLEQERIEREEAAFKQIMKNARKVLNNGLKRGEREFDIPSLGNRVVDLHLNMLITEYKAAGWNVIHHKKQRPGDPTDGWDYLEFK